MENNELKTGVDINKLFLPSAILIAAVLISGTLLYTRSGADNPQVAAIGKDQKKVEVSIDDDAFLGDKSSPVKIIEFSDFQCPFCRKFWKETLPQIKKDYIDTGKAVLVYRDFPLSIHPAAVISAQATECADEQGKYWEFHDKIFAEQEKKGAGTVDYGVNDLKKWAREIGLDSVKFNQCLDSQKYKEEVEKDFADGSAAGVSGTPATFVNGKLIVGAQPFTVFQQAIEEELKNGPNKNSFFK